MGVQVWVLWFPSATIATRTSTTTGTSTSQGRQGRNRLCCSHTWRRFRIPYLWLCLHAPGQESRGVGPSAKQGDVGWTLWFVEGWLQVPYRQSPSWLQLCILVNVRVNSYNENYSESWKGIGEKKK